MSAAAIAATKGWSERRGELIMLVLALLMLPIVLAEELTADRAILGFAETASGTIWMVFVVEYLLLLRGATDRRTFIRVHWFDLLIILISPPYLPPELQAFRTLRIARVLLVLGILGRGQYLSLRMLKRGGLPYLAVFALFVVFLGGLTIHTLEPDRFVTVWDGLWWSIVTATTVGYGDIAPATFQGRAVAVFLMVVGLATFASLTAGIASFFVQSEETALERRVAAMERMLDDIRRDLRTLVERDQRR